MTAEARWLVLTHHLPPDPPYLRAKIRRRLERLGAEALKSSVYVLPNSDAALEDFSWLRQEIQDEGGEATLATATFVDGVTNERLLAQFRTRRDADYAEIVVSARDLLDDLLGTGPGNAAIEGKIQRLEKRLQEVKAVDFYQAPGRAAAERAVGAIEEARTEATSPVDASGPGTAEVGRGRTWVTRVGVDVDRMASAWLIRKFIDPEARFQFVPGRGYEPAEGDLRFDMFEGEFTHVGEACTFEVLRTRFALADPALTPLAEIVHDIDCKVDEYGRPETAGVASTIDGIKRRHADDPVRLERGAELFDSLYEHFASGA
jgi:hypothetical protein